MSRAEGFLERILWTIASRISGRSLAALVFLLYAGGGLALPLALNWPLPTLVGLNFLCTTLAGLLILMWLSQRVEARERRHLVEWTSNLRLLTAEEFEWLVGEVFRREGWQMRETGSQEKPDGNIDLELTRPGERMIVQCKRWYPRNVRVEEIRQFAGTLSREKLPSEAGIFVTLSGFTEWARAEARTMGMTLIDNRELHSRIDKVRRSEPCPDCQEPMVLSRSPRGWWLRCVASDCQGKRDLGNDPGRAVDLLMRPPAL
jgi:HJR/Mrr/RecB family endonuclease